MLKKILATAAPLALLAMATVPAHAADPRGYAPAYAASASWADLTAAVGMGRSTDVYDNSETFSSFRGEGRYGMAFGGGMFQLDVSGDGAVWNNNYFGSDSANPTFDIAAHFGLISGPGAGYGVMVSVGESTNWVYDRVATIAGEATWGLGALGPARLTAQAGWTASLTDSDSVGYIIGVLDFLVNPNVLLSVKLGYSSDNDSTVAWRYGAKAEMAFNQNVSGFLEWDGSHQTNGGWSYDANRVMVGATFSVNGTTLANRSPNHDRNPWTGIDHLN